MGLIFSTGTPAAYSFGMFVRSLTTGFDRARIRLFAALSFLQFGRAFASPLQKKRSTVSAHARSCCSRVLTC